MAILLYEESLVACFGYSPLDVSHTPHIREADLDANLGRQVRMWSGAAQLSVAGCRGVILCLVTALFVTLFVKLLF